MESRIRVLFLIIAMVSMTGCAATKNLFGIGPKEAPPPASEPPGQVIDPEVERREVKEPAIDREDFELGAFVGIMSIEDFQRVSYDVQAVDEDHDSYTFSVQLDNSNESYVVGVEPSDID